MKFSHQRALARYYSMPKEFVGPHQADDLISMHETLGLAKKSWSYQFVAGSAAAESGLIGTNLDSSERHARIRAADKSWKRAQDGFISNHLQQDWSESRLYTIPDRIEMHRSYLELYHDMADGAVRIGTLEKTHHRLVQIAMSNKYHHDIAEATGDYPTMVNRRGLAYELGTLLTITRLKCPSLFTVPVPARADHGEYFPDKTHDVRLIQQSWGQINWCIPYEVKPTAHERWDHYESALVRGRVELLMPATTEPLEIATYMYEEENGGISAQHLDGLDEITSRVLRLAQDYKIRQSLAKSALIAV